MTQLRQRMLEDMQIRNFSENTRQSYLQQVSLFARHLSSLSDKREEARRLVYCSGFVGGIATRSVHAGEIQGRCLGMDVHVWSENGQEVLGQAGELVIASPAPSMPLRFWGDDDYARYLESYFSTFPGVWRHGDHAKINERGGVYIYGRSDSTLNRFGVRIGSSEIYNVMERVPGVVDSLVVCCETPGGGYYMPLFVTLAPGMSLDESLRLLIIRQLRIDASPRHVPDEIYQAPAIPYTLTGKKMEVPIRKILMGVPVEKAATRDAMINPTVLMSKFGAADEPRTQGVTSCEGAKVCLVDTNKAGLDRLIEEVGSGNAAAAVADVSSDSGADTYLRKTLEAFGRIDLLHSNAGIIGEPGLIHEASSANFDRVFAVNVRSLVLALGKVVPEMSKQQSLSC